jgi:hypothetical protein
MSTVPNNVRPGQRPKVSQVSTWYSEYENSIDLSWRGGSEITIKVEQGYPFPDFYRITTVTDGAKKSKLFYGESAWSQVNMYVNDLGFYNFIGV